MDFIFAMHKLCCVVMFQITHIKLIFKINEKLMKKELMHEIKKEVINARLKSFDTYSSSGSGFSISALRPPSSLVLDSVSSTTRYTSPRKRNSSSASASASNSPVMGLSSSQSGSYSVRSGGGRTKGASPIALASGGSQILPFSSSDLTIRPTSQPLTSPFLNDPTSKQSTKSVSSGSTSSDGDVFKKPAPVSGVRSFH